MIKDPMSALTHFIAFIISIFLAPVLLVHAAGNGADLASMVSLSIFILSMIMLYGASSAYHTFDISKHVNLVLKKIDHMMIFVLIAGSYTPICMIALPSNIGRGLLILVWGFAIVGMAVKFFWVTCPKWFSSIIYIGMGWSCIIALPQIKASLGSAGFAWLLAGGIIYTIGGVIYALKLDAFNKRFKNWGSHEIFHLFVIVGSLCHFVTMYHYLFTR
ncbi:MAG: hemolysin III family protein [Lachnospiraceae bacterium]